MKTTMLRLGAAFLGLALLVACSEITGDPARDCLAATQDATKALVGKATAEGLLAKDPENETLQQAVAIADALLQAAVANREALCAPPAPTGT